MTTKTILLVEDDPDDEILTLRGFRECHVANQVIVAHDGIDALDYLFATGKYEGRDVLDSPAVVLLDLNLPKLDGLEILRRLRGDPRTRTIPVVILTSSAEEQDRIKGYALGANSYVRKPVDFSEFIAAAAQLGLYWLVLNQASPPAPGM